MTTTTRTLTGCKIYWDMQDPRNQGWAYRAHFSDGHEESGPWEGDLQDDAAGQELADAVVELAYQHGEEISTDVVTCEPRVDGGFAKWDR